jgi:hypothetical protein
MSESVTVMLSREDADGNERAVTVSVRVYPAWQGGGHAPEPAWGEVEWAEDAQTHVRTDLTCAEENRALDKALEATL